MTKHRVYPWILGIFFTIFMAYPLVHVISRAFILDGSPSLRFFQLMFQNEHYREVLFNSLNLALAVTLLCTVCAYPLALLLSRYEVPAAGFLHSLLLLPLVVPPFVGVLGVRQLFSRFGSVNVFLLNNNLIEAPINWLGGSNVLGIIALQVIHLVPVLYLSIGASLHSAHVSLEEAALMSGASRWRILRHIIIPLSLPGWFAGATLVFIASFTDLGTPLIFEYRNVISVQIYNMLSDLHENPVGYSFVVFTCVFCISIFTLSKASMVSGSFASSGRGRQGRLQRPLGLAWRYLVPFVVALYGTLACVPQIAVALIALSKEWFMSVFPQQWTLSHFVEILYHPLTARSLVISICLSLAASVVTVWIGFLTAYSISRGSRWSRLIFEFASITPLAVPGIVFAFGFIGAFSGTILDNRINPFPLLIAAYAVRRMPAMVRSAYAGLQEANITLEEAARMVGTPPATIARAIIFPLMSSHLVVGAMLTFAYSMIEVSDSLLLALESKFYPVSKAIYALMGRPDGIELASALGVVVMVIMLLAFYCAERISQRSSRSRALKTVIITITLLCSSSAFADSDEIIAVTPHWEGIRSEFARGFAAEWRRKTGREITIRWLDIGGASDIVKYLKSQFKQQPTGIGIDLFFGGGSDSFLELERDNLLAPASISPSVLAAIPSNLSGIPLYSPNRTWFANALSTFGILYNKVAVERLRLPVPRRWSDLANPDYFDLIGAGDPRKSGSMHAMYEIMLQGYGWQNGWQLLQRFARNVRNFAGGASQIGKEVATGEMVYGIAIDTYAGDIIRQVGRHRLGYILPEDFASINGDSIGLLTGAPHPAAATAFIEFLLSEAGQKLWYAKKGSPGGPVNFEIGKLPVLPALYNKVPAATMFDINPFTLTNVLAYDASLASSRWNLFNDLFGAFIIDVHDRLVHVADPSRLTGIPVSEQEAQQLIASGTWTSRVGERSNKLREWGEQARTSLPIQESMAERLRWLPGSLLALILGVIALGRLATFVRKTGKNR